ncbi:alpha/beta hydrolase [Rhizobium fabae]|uniref:Acetyl esterase/lipase n=1 Tax=Rhizobium fabae TaxID=573179 RepID=A0A7W6BC13_9HYPH|nr:alpha/beta hydrolase [Rhizobium fabae]MBB3919510.1 acetyl esterase/lipase [Rhizobium fabae]RUM06259.1 alpha/beta hydrolase [Rhizobium fabae]
MTEVHGIDWEDAFANAAYIEGGMAYPESWALKAEAFRKEASCELDIPYGDSPRERFDLFHPSGSPKGLAVFVHGGYWLDFDKSSWSHLAQGALSMGWAVALPSYTLAPDARINEITREIGRAIGAAAERVDGPIRLAGHSAGGHLVSRMVCDDSPLSKATSDAITRVVSISGLHDLRPLRLHSMNEQLRLGEAEAAAESAVLRRPRQGIELVAWVGARERPEFLRQSALIVEAWGRRGRQTELVAEAGRHHFDVIDGLSDPEHPLTKAFAGP